MARRAPIRLTAWRGGGAVFILLLAAYGYVFPRWSDWNQNSRFDLTRALVEQGGVSIDRYVANTGDYAIVNGRYVSDKAPGLSLLAVPPYALYRLASAAGPVRGLAETAARGETLAGTLNPDGTGVSGGKVETALALAWVTFACVAVPTALLGVLLFRLFGRFSRHMGANAVVAATLMLATPLAAYGNAFYGHALAAALTFAAFALLLAGSSPLRAGRAAAIGALLGATIVVEYPAALIVAALGCWVLVRAVRARAYGAVGWLLAGGAPFAATLAAYDLAAYGTLLPTGYAHSTLWQDKHTEGFLSLTYPKPDALWGVLGGDFRGLCFVAPVVLLAVPGFVVWWRTGRDRGAWWVCLWATASMLLFAASSAMWWGGFAIGPRYVLPMIPFCLYPIGVLIPTLVRVRAAAVAAGLLALVSLVQVWMQIFAGQQYPPDTLHRTVPDYVWPQLVGGNVARNLGMAFGLHGLWSTLPLAAVLAAGAAWCAVHDHMRPLALSPAPLERGRYVGP